MERLRGIMRQFDKSGLTVIVEQVPVIVEHRIVGGIGKSIAL